MDIFYGLYILARKPRKNIPRRKPVTIIVGLICDGAIILASDTQATYGIARLPDTIKISLIEFKNLKVLMAESGDCSLSAYAVTIFKRMAANTTIEKDDDVAQVAQAAVREVRNDQATLFPGNHTLEEWKRYFRDESRFTLMFAYYFKTEPFIYTISLDECIPVKCRSHFATCGIGEDLGNYLMREHSKPRMHYWVGAFISTFVVETVKEYVEGCGGKTHVGLIRSLDESMFRPAVITDVMETLPNFVSYADEQVAIFSQSYVDKMASEMARIIGTAKEQARANIAAVLETETGKVAEQMKDAIDKFMEDIKRKYGPKN
jgi:hypothetical protein